MGINDAVLAEFDLSTGESVRIEHTESGQVHLHVDSVRLNLTESEFEEVAATTAEAHEELRRIKDL